MQQPVPCLSFASQPRLTTDERNTQAESIQRMEKSQFALLPPELISTIFQSCLPDNPGFMPSDAPLLLTHVCRAWRAIASDIPQLWSQIVVPRWQELAAGVYELATLWVARSGRAPLSVDISLFDQDVLLLPDAKESDKVFALMQRLLALLAPHRTRIQSLCGVFPNSVTPDVGIPEMINAERIFYYGMLNVDTVLRSTGDGHAEIPQIKLDLGPAKDILRILSICNCAVDLNSVKLQTQITHLELFNLHRDTGLCQEIAFGLMQNLPALTKCVMELTRHERVDWAAPRKRVIMDNLELLFVLWTFPADIGVLLDSVSTPKLIRLGLRGAPTTRQRPWSGLYNFLQASQAPLKRISLGNFGDVDLRLIECLRCCPELMHLSLNHCAIPNEVFQALTCAGETWDIQLLPRLSLFNMIVCAGLKAESVSAFIKSRAKNVPPGFLQLQEVEIAHCTDITESDVFLFDQCGVERLILKVATDNPA